MPSRRDDQPGRPPFVCRDASSMSGGAGVAFVLVDHQLGRSPDPSHVSDLVERLCSRPAIEPERHRAGVDRAALGVMSRDVVPS